MSAADSNHSGEILLKQGGSSTTMMDFFAKLQADRTELYLHGPLYFNVTLTFGENLLRGRERRKQLSAVARALHLTVMMWVEDEVPNAKWVCMRS